MKNVIKLILLVSINVSAWEINTHRAIERKAIEASENLKTFVENADIQNTNYSNERFEGYHKNNMGDYTYLDYVTNGEGNGISYKGWQQTFGNSYYQSLIEAGSILEDAQWPHSPNTLDFADRADGRFVNHFYDAQDGGHALTYGAFLRTNATGLKSWQIKQIY
jgi:hypothetical protein